MNLGARALCPNVEPPACKMLASIGKTVPGHALECFICNSKYMRIHAGHVLSTVCTYCVNVINRKLLVRIDGNQHNAFTPTKHIKSSTNARSASQQSYLLIHQCSQINY